MSHTASNLLSLWPTQKLQSLRKTNRSTQFPTPKPSKFEERDQKSAAKRDEVANRIKPYRFFAIAGDDNFTKTKPKIRLAQQTQKPEYSGILANHHLYLPSSYRGGRGSATTLVAYGGCCHRRSRLERIEEHCRPCHLGRAEKGRGSTDVSHYGMTSITLRGPVGSGSATTVPRELQ